VLRLASAACLGAVVGSATPSATQAAALVIHYRAASEDEASTGRLRLPLAAGKPSTAVVAEFECRVSARPNADAPQSDADQFWRIHAELTKDAKGRASARVRYRLVKPSGAGAEQQQVIVLDGRDTLAIEGFSARTDCRYDRILVTISGA
jgi:hypothetical protein